MLRRIISTILLFTVISVISLGAFTNTSFRNASTAYLLEDDYDLWLGPYPLPDPARLPLIEGSRLYTNLSNLVDKGEEPFSNYTNNYFLIGGSTTPLFNLGHFGIVIDRYNDKEALYTGLDDMDGFPIDGYGHVVYSEFFDDDNNGTYDRRTDVEETREVWTDEGIKDFILCFGKDLDRKLLGLFYRLNTTNTEEYGYDIMGMPVNFTFDSTDFNLESGNRTFTESRVGTGSATNDMIEHLFGLSFWKYLNETRAFGLHFGYGMFSGTSKDVRDKTDNWNGSPDDPSITDTYTMTEEYEDNIPYKGNSMTGWLSYIHDWNEITHLRFDASYNRSSFEIENDARGYYSIIGSRIAADNHTEATNGSETTEITGDGSSQTVSVSGKVIYDLTEKVKFAFGLGLLSSRMDSTRVESEDARFVFAYDDGDNEPNDNDDYTQTTTYSSTVQTKTTEGMNSISFPVCVEFNVKNPLVFRLGAIHSINLTETTTNMDLIDASPGLVHTERGDGTVTDVFIDNPNLEDIGSSEDITVSSSNTTYTYGLGYTVSENLQIDLMGFSDLTDLSNWRVSATLKF